MTKKDTEELYQEMSAREFSVLLLLLFSLSTLVCASIFIVFYLFKALIYYCLLK